MSHIYEGVSVIAGVGGVIKAKWHRVGHVRVN